MALIEAGHNIASTHQAVLYYTQDTLDMLREKNYTIIIDEEITVFEKGADVSDGDIRLFIDAGYLQESKNGCYTKTDKEYTGTVFRKMFRIMETRPLLNIGSSEGNASLWYWIYPKDFLECANEVILLTYLFKGSEMDLFFQMCGIKYQYIGVERRGDSSYALTDKPGDMPAYINSLSEKIHIFDDEKLNAIGKNRNALSMNWYEKNPDKVDELRCCISNYFKHKVHVSASQRLCGTYSEAGTWSKIRNKGYWNSKLAFNKKSTNDYREKTALVYPVNLFPNTGIVTYYYDKGLVLDQERYALSTMIQWIWRSAIRDGKEISIYIPSRRMRTLLINWINEVSKGGIYET